MSMHPRTWYTVDHNANLQTISFKLIPPSLFSLQVMANKTLGVLLSTSSLKFSIFSSRRITLNTLSIQISTWLQHPIFGGQSVLHCYPAYKGMLRNSNGKSDHLPPFNFRAFLPYTVPWTYTRMFPCFLSDLNWPVFISNLNQTELAPNIYQVLRSSWIPNPIVLIQNSRHLSFKRACCTLHHSMTIL